MTWHDTKEQRRKNRGERGSDQRRAFLTGRRHRKGLVLLTDKKTGETSILAENGCFGKLVSMDRDLYDAWAEGTKGTY